LGGETADKPKCMVDIGGKPVLRHIIEWLVDNDVRDVMVNLHYQPWPVIDYFRDGRKFGARMVYSVEEELLGSAGAVGHTLRWFGGRRFVAVYGDVLCRFGLTDMMREHAEHAVPHYGPRITMAVHESSRPSECGVVVMDGRRIASIEEKPAVAKTNYVNAGAVLLDPEGIPPLAVGHDIAKDLIPSAIAIGTPVFAYDVGSDAMDMGTPERLAKARREWV